jgi:hypothetical protein
MTLIIQTDTNERPNTTDREGTLNSNHKTSKTIPIHQPTERT